MKSIDDLFNLKGKVAVLIGGAGYLCSAIGKAFDDAGVKTCVLDVQDLPSKSKTYPKEYWKCDATSKKDLERCKKEIVSKYGRVDILLNAAGVNAPTPFLKIEAAEMDRILQSHVHSTL